MNKINVRYILPFTLITLLILISSVNATDFDNSTLGSSSNNILTDFNEVDNSKSATDVKSLELKNQIINAEDGDVIVISPGKYYLHNIQITKNITLQGNGAAKNIIIDGEKLSSILFVEGKNSIATLKNITFINGQTDYFGGAIYIDEGQVYIDNCIFKDNKALGDTSGGAIANYGLTFQPGILVINNSLFINNYAEHDGGAVTTTSSITNIYNSIFINNTAHRDGGAVRMNFYGEGYVEDCIFMFNHADEWGGAYYSWSGESSLKRCIFLNNTAGTHGGAIMLSGNFNITESILVNNSAEETGGSFYIKQPGGFKGLTDVDINYNLITNNTAPVGKEIDIEWIDTVFLFTDFNDNDWGDEDPNGDNIIDPNKITKKSKVTSTIKSNLLNVLNLNSLNQYAKLLEDFFPEKYFGDLDDEPFFYDENKKAKAHNTKESEDIKNIEKTNKNKSNKMIKANSTSDIIRTNQTESFSQPDGSKEIIANTTQAGNDNKAYEINKTNSAVKTSSPDLKYFIILFIIVFLALLIGYKEKRNDN